MAQIDLTERRTTTDRSGSITVGGTSQQLCAAFGNRAYLYIQNPSAASESLFVNESAAASTTAANCWELQPGEHLEWIAQGFVPVGAFNVTANTAGHAFIAKEA